MSMSSKKCCVPGCMESGGSHKTLHRFPNPGKDKDYFSKWVYAIGGDIVGLNNFDIYKYRRVCHSHFEEKFCCRYNRLSKIAVPTLNLPGSLSLPKFTMEERRPVRQMENYSLSPSVAASSALTSFVPPDLYSQPQRYEHMQENIGDPVVNQLIPEKSLPTSNVASTLTSQENIDPVVKQLTLTSTKSSLVLESTSASHPVPHSDELMQENKVFQKMTNEFTCRICLEVEEAQHSIFDVESKECIREKILECFNEMIEDIEGYPKKICELCLNKLNIAYSFITEYRNSCKLLETALVVAKQEADDKDTKKENVNIEIEFINEPEFYDFLRTHDYCLVEDNIILPIVKEEESKQTLVNIELKLKKLPEINLEKIPAQDSKKLNLLGEIASSTNIKAQENCNILPKRKSTRIKRTEKPTLHRNKRKTRQPKLCDTCGEVFEDKARLLSHLEQVHSRKHYQCPECPAITQFNCKLNLDLHIKRQHGVKKFICDFCGYAYALIGDLNKHVKYIHLKKREPPKRFTCKSCDRTFATAKQAIIHERAAHTGERPFGCEVCGKRFCHECYLEEHMRTHTGEKPFQCPICYRGHSQRNNVKSHIRHNHRLEDLDELTKKSLQPKWFKYLKP